MTPEDYYRSDNPQFWKDWYGIDDDDGVALEDAFDADDDDFDYDFDYVDE